MSPVATPQAVNHTDVRILQQLLVNLKRAIVSAKFDESQISSKLAIVDDERDVRNLRVFNLNVIHHENLRRQLPHKSSSRASESVKGGKLCRGVHVTMLQDCQI